ncbi:hypothetical protein AAFF_G00424290 [Aldrovandia affinis]|uniref:Uncharacterized protein n=1 Tax=Aldrovandia affinis TaxID=143900 RepID=A0AAD7T6N5_9TELE|nr:hypothetical protein AAFF_G00424290 [Aldrovandia affinis]
MQDSLQCSAALRAPPSMWSHRLGRTLGNDRSVKQGSEKSQLEACCAGQSFARDRKLQEPGGILGLSRHQRLCV